MAKYIPLAFEINLRPEGFVFDVGSLFEVFAGLHDQRDARGVRYALTTILTCVVLAKLAGENQLRGIAQWVKLNVEELTVLLGLQEKRAPHATTISRILGKAIGIDELECATSAFFAAQPHCGREVHLILDGKVIRGTIPAGKTRGVHLLAAYVPNEGWVMLQVAVTEGENEIPTALRVAKRLDVRGKIVTGDALLAQRTLAAEIIKRGGDYLWVIKDNQPETLAALETLFAPEACVPGFSPASHHDFDETQTVEKGHGRIEARTLTASSSLNDYLDWPQVSQVFQVERRFLRMSDGKEMHQVHYGLTSLTHTEASPPRLLALLREHWQIETGLHYRRDDTLREDRCTVRTGHAAQAMAVLNNVVLGIVKRIGWRYLPDARRHYAKHFQQSTTLILERL
jgi:predicted transposase YbfD/YdcC